ncbi:MAG TPA: hypothetical protein VK841_26635, partial [Polyangiaceae bacterium]|nr:hypothetical protein [Polyangiaceae bacterium]
MKASAQATRLHRDLEAPGGVPESGPRGESRQAHPAAGDAWAPAPWTGAVTRASGSVSAEGKASAVPSAIA